MEDAKMPASSEKDTCAMPGVCACPHHKIIPIVIILIGLVFLLEAMGVLGTVAANILWPLLIIVYGIVKWIGGSCKCYHKHY
jgi:hypothetical protein